MPVQKQSFWAQASTGVSALSGLILLALLLSRLSVPDFGTWILFQAASGLLDMFRSGLLRPGLLQLSAGQNRKMKAEIFSSVQYIFILITSIQVVFCWSLYFEVADSSPWHFFFENYPLIILSGGNGHIV